MANMPNDLQFVADLVAGNVHAPVNAGQQPQSRNTRRKEGQRDAPQHRSGTHTKPSHPQNSNQQPKTSNKTKTKNSGGGSTSPDHTEAESPYNQPSKASTDKALHCEACDVWIPNKTDTWSVHTAGIRHRRQVLSLKVSGERGTLVVSSFESLPGPGESTHRLVGKGASDFRALNNATRAKTYRNTAIERYFISWVQKAARVHLINAWGSGREYHRLYQHFTDEAKLRTALRWARYMLDHGNKTGRLLVGTSPLNMAALAYLLECPEAINGRAPTFDTIQLETAPGLNADSAELDAIEIQRIDRITGIDPYQSAATLEDPATSGLWLTCTCILLSALKHCLSLTHIGVLGVTGVPPDGAVHNDPAIWRGHGYYFRGSTFNSASPYTHRGWLNVLEALRVLVSERPDLHSLRITFVQPRDWDSGAGIVKLFTKLQQDVKTHLSPEAVLRTKTQILLGLHPRVGKCCLLNLLPVHVLRQIMDMAAHPTGCRCRVTREIEC